VPTSFQATQLIITHGLKLSDLNQTPQVFKDTTVLSADAEGVYSETQIFIFRQILLPHVLARKWLLNPLKWMSHANPKFHIPIQALYNTIIASGKFEMATRPGTSAMTVINVFYPRDLRSIPGVSDAFSVPLLGCAPENCTLQTMYLGCV